MQKAILSMSDNWRPIINASLSHRLLEASRAHRGVFWRVKVAHNSQCKRVQVQDVWGYFQQKNGFPAIRRWRHDLLAFWKANTCSSEGKDWLSAKFRVCSGSKAKSIQPLIPRTNTPPSKRTNKKTNKCKKNYKRKDKHTKGQIDRY